MDGRVGTPFLVCRSLTWDYTDSATAGPYESWNSTPALTRHRSVSVRHFHWHRTDLLIDAISTRPLLPTTSRWHIRMPMLLFTSAADIS